MPKRERLSEKLVKAAVPGMNDYQVFDDDVRGFAVRVYRSGSRAFTLDYRAQGRPRRYVIGSWPEWSVTAARERARLIRRDVDAGQDPAARRESERAAPRVGSLIDRFIEEHLPRLAPRNAADQESMLRKLVEPHWKHRLVAEITPADVEKLLGTVALGRARPSKATAKSRGKRKLQPARSTPIRANRCGEVLRKMFALAVVWRMRDDNPAQGFRKRDEVERDRFLTTDELQRVAEALGAATDQRGAGIVRLLMLTGARLGEVRKARFDQFSLERAIWTKQAATTKQRRIHRLPISRDAVALVRLRRGAVPPDCAWLFPGDVEVQPGDAGQPVTEIRRFWRGIQTTAGIPDVRVHDLRHTVASLLISGGSSLEMIGKLLGHTQAKTTMRYAHLMDSPLRDGVNNLADILKPRLRVVSSSD